MDTKNALRTLIENFIQERLQAKLAGPGGNDENKRQKLFAEHQREAWLANAAIRVTKLQLATHIVKGIHPGVKKHATNIYLRRPWYFDRSLVGTHLLTEDRTSDVAGDTAVFDVFKFLRLIHQGESLLQRVQRNDPVLLGAFSDDLEQAHKWMASFAAIGESKGYPSSDTLAKQLYFPVSEGSYHLLGPLYPTVLVHRLYNILKADRFSEAASAARNARKENLPWPNGYREYPHLVIQKLGGSNTQNVSPLNNERSGANHLLPSLPPTWQSESITLPRGKSIFGRYGAFSNRRAVRELTRVLREFLASTRDWNNVQIRNKRASLVDEIIDQLLHYVTSLREHFPSGWSAAPECRLDAVEKLLLDPAAIRQDADGHAAFPSAPTPDWTAEIADRFAKWLNAAIRTDRTPMGDEEHREWKVLVTESLAELEEIAP